MPLRCDALGVFELADKIVDRLLVERGLLAAQQAERLHFGLVRQVRDDALVGLHAPQDVGAHQLAQRAVGIVRPLGELLDEAGELLGRSQQSGIDEVEDRPEVAEPVLDRRAGQGDARVGLELLDRLVCLAAGFLIACASSSTTSRHCASASHARAGQKAVAGDGEIDAGEVGGGVHLLPSAGNADGWTTTAFRLGANRAISAAQLASSEAGATSSDGLRFGPPPAL